MDSSINYLRVSVTDRCNLRCIYCLPKSGEIPLSRAEILTYEEIIDAVRCAMSLGIKKIRITGGEPLLRKGLVKLIQQLSTLNLEDLSLTTNGTLLKKYVTTLKSAGIKRINISLDTLNFKKYAYITQREDIGLGDVLDGILEAIKVGFSPLKINVVVMRGVNEGEVVDFVKFGMSKGVCVRFIEFMPLNKGIDMYVSNKEVKDRIEKYFKLIPTDFSQGAGPAEYFQVDGSKCKVGFISPRSGNICKNCNRIRLTSDGKLRPCLLSNTEIDLKKALREGKGIEELFSFALRIKTKPYSYNERLNRSMLQIGG